MAQVHSLVFLRNKIGILTVSGEGAPSLRKVNSGNVLPLSCGTRLIPDAGQPRGNLLGLCRSVKLILWNACSDLI